MCHSDLRARLMHSLSILSLLFLAACSTSTTQERATATDTPSPVVATQTPTTQQRCQALQGYAGAGAATTFPGLADVPLPAGTFLTAPQLSGGSPSTFAITEADACTISAGNANAVRSFFAQNLPVRGWVQSETFPYDGGRQATCGDPYCWSKDAAPRYVSLEKVTDAGQGMVIYHLRLAFPPSLPIGQFCGTSKWTTVWHGAPLPPLSTVFGGSSTFYSGDVAVCSAGTKSSLDAFFQSELPKANWLAQSPPSSSRCFIQGANAWWNGTIYFAYDLSLWTTANPYYHIDYCAP